jgi:hypothetical protein
MNALQLKCASITLISFLLIGSAQGATTWLYTPESISDISGRVYADAGAPAHLTNMSTFGQTSNAVSQTITGWNLGTYTGVTSPSPLSDYQRGINNSVAGSSAVQMTGTEMGVIIKTSSIPGGSGYNGNLANGQTSYQWTSQDNVRPWAYSDSVFNMSYDLKIPQATITGNACAYACASILIKDGTGKYFWIQPQMFDTRGAPHTEYYGWDNGTNSGYVNTFFDASNNRTYCSLLSGSYASTGSTWSDWHYYGYSISTNQLLSAINSINTAFNVGLSTDTSTYWLNLITIQEEAYWPSGTSAVATMGIRNMTAWDTYTPVPEPSTLALLLCGATSLGLLIMRHRR